MMKFDMIITFLLSKIFSPTRYKFLPSARSLALSFFSAEAFIQVYDGYMIPSSAANLALKFASGVQPEKHRGRYPQKPGPCKKTKSRIQYNKNSKGSSVEEGSSKKCSQNSQLVLLSYNILYKQAQAVNPRGPIEQAPTKL